LEETTPETEGTTPEGVYEQMLKEKLNAVLDRYRTHPEFLGIEIENPNQPGAVDDTVLHIASRTGAVEDMRVLIACGANVNALGDLGNTPLHGAAMKGQVEAARVLLQSGAAVDIRNEFGQTALEVAELRGHKDVVDVLKSSTGQSA